MGTAPARAAVRLRFATEVVAVTGRVIWRAAWAAARRAAVVVGVVVAGWGLAHAAERGVVRIRPVYAPSTLSAERGQTSFLACLEARLRASVPRHANVYVDNPDVASQQRLTELATPWAQVVSERGAARYSVAIRPGDGPTSCGGTTVVVHPR